MKFSEKFKEFQGKRKESKAFRSIVEERAQVTRRQAYAEESAIQARAEGKRLAQRRAEKRANPIGKRMLSGLASFAEQPRSAPVRRAPVRRTTKKRAPAKRAPIRRAPTRKRAPAQKPLLPMKEYFG